MTLKPRPQLPPFTVDDLMRAAGKSRRTMLDIIRQYAVATGGEIARYPKRNFLEMRLTQEQHDEILNVIRRSEEEGYSYAELFHELATGRMLNQPLNAGGEGTVDERVANLEAQLGAANEQLREVLAALARLEGKTDVLQTTLDKAVHPLE